MMWHARGPVWLDEGEWNGYIWLQCSDFLVEEFVAVCPELLQGKWVIMTCFDHERLLPFKESRGTDPTVWVGEPKRLSGLDDLPWSGNEDMFYIFDDEPSPDALSVLEDPGYIFQQRFLNLKLDETQNFWSMLRACGASSFFVRGDFSFLAVRNRELAENFKRSDYVKNYHLIHVAENRRALESWLASETADEKCGIRGCTQLRVKVAANCPRHHFEMLYGQPFPDDLLE